MPEVINIYCDESCHLEHDGQDVMLLGAIWCPQLDIKTHAQNLKILKTSHHFNGELKWTKVSPSREDYFLNLVDYFFSSDKLNFRCLIVKNKSLLDHTFYNQGSHDSFYYKMFFYLLTNIISTNNSYNIYLDIKDTRSQNKIIKLHEVICSYFRDFENTVIKKIQHVRAQEIELLQLADFLIGSISYLSRKIDTSETKKKIVLKIKNKAGFDIESSTPPWEEKFNLFYFKPRDSR